MNTLLIVANIFGYIGILLLYTQVVFGSRHIFKYITKDTVLVNKWHSKIGKYSIFAVLLHPLLTMMNRLEDFAWIFTPNFNVQTEAQITLGRFALAAFLAVWVTSALIRGKIKWHPWKWVHLLSYPIVFLSLLHLKDIGTFYNDYFFIRVLWAIMLIDLVLVILLRLIKWSGFTKPQYTLKSKEFVGTDILIIKLTPPKSKITSKIGQHFFLQANRFRSEHPFSIVSNQDGELTFGIRKVGKFFDSINKKEIGKSVFVDGPYGTFTAEAQNTNPKVVISGGIGVTPFIDLIDKFGQGVTYINCNKKIEEAYSRDLLKSKTTKYIDIVDSYDGEPRSDILVGRITSQIIRDTVGAELTTMPYFVCGSPMFISVIKKMLMEVGVPKTNVYWEELGF